MIDFGHCKFSFEKLDFSSLTLYRTNFEMNHKKEYASNYSKAALLSKEEKNIAKILCGPLFVAHLLELDS
jgi:hypothetical protein